MLVVNSCAWHLSVDRRLEECAGRSIFLEFIHEVNRYYRATSRFTHNSPTGHVSSMALAAFGAYTAYVSAATRSARRTPRRGDHRCEASKEKIPICARTVLSHSRSLSLS